MKDIKLDEIFKCNNRLFSISQITQPTDNDMLGDGLGINEFYYTAKKDISDRTK